MLPKDKEVTIEVCTLYCVCLRHVFLWTLEKLKVLSSGGSMFARMKLKGIDGKAPQGVELAA